MSRVIIINENGVNYTFFCRSENTRNGFKHVVELFIGGYRQAFATCYYLNRTWEKYCYQSACLQAVYNRKNEIIDDNLKCFKALHNYSKMTKKRTEEFNQYMDSTGSLDDLKAVYKQLQDNCY